MLSPYDAELAHRDKAIPGLSTVLDGEELIRALSRTLPGLELQSAMATYVRYKPGTNCLVSYELVAEGQRLKCYAKAYRRDARDKLGNALEKPGVEGPLGPGRIVLSDLALVVSVFPNDSQLKALAYLAGGDAQTRLLRKLLPTNPDLWDASVCPIRYKPERRYVAQLRVDNVPRAALKIYAESDFPAVCANAQAFGSRDVLVVPGVLGSLERRQLLAFDWLEGSLLNEALDDAVPDLGQLEMVGAALAEVHAHDASRLRPLTRQAEASSLLSVADGVAYMYPGISRRLQGLALQLAAQLTQQPAERLSIHGDFYDRQVLLTGKKVAVLDFDAAKAGDPASDLGLFIAHMECANIQGDARSHEVAPLREALVRGYVAASGKPEQMRSSIELYTAASLLRLAPHPFRNRHPNWPTVIEGIVARAEAIHNALSEGPGIEE